MSYWWACEFPERPGDGLQRWHYDDCAACRLKFEATLRQMRADADPVRRVTLRQAENILHRMEHGAWPEASHGCKNEPGP